MAAIERREFLRHAGLTAAACLSLSEEAFTRGPSVTPVPERVDYIELNHCYNCDTGDLRFRQLIFWSRQNGAVPHVRAWVIVDTDRANVPLLTKTNNEDTQRPNYLCVIKKDSQLFHIQSTRFKTTHTFHDPEEDDRKTFPQEARQPLKAW